jgi:MoxR-like ATPase
MNRAATGTPLGPHVVHSNPQSSGAATAAIHQHLQQLEQALCGVIRGNGEAVHMALVALLSEGHLLIEDVPGVGKTTLAHALANAIHCTFHRVQFTSDLLPSDVVGVSVYNQSKESFEFKPGPIFTNILLADEINRASPRTQSALLEAMGEGQVSVEGDRRNLESLFFVIATQNPVEMRGTYPLPEAQMDRFALQFSLGYVSAAEEVAVLTAQEKAHPLDKAGSVVTKDNVLALKLAVTEVRISEELKRYIVDLVSATRKAQGVSLGASPRASLALMKVAQAAALFEFVTPEHVQQMAVPVIAHRMVMDPQARFSGVTARGVVEELLKKLKVPA